ncbi:SRPBCC domain-containing protein [Streptomyces sp. NPDC013187]|uniref:SRPBCC domain-containing protein n=1 Tax=Streptomyces sp. NPDC013187 TaxID=3364865 RepID=UPI00367C73FB
MTADVTGTCLTLEGGRPAVRFSRVCDHPVDRVRQFVTDADELERWFPSRAEIDLRPGGTIRFSGARTWRTEPAASSPSRTPPPATAPAGRCA